jgi:hypothetical protein
MGTPKPFGFSHGIRLLSEGVQFSTDAYAVAAVEMPYFSLVNYVEFVQRFKCIAGLYVYKYIYIRTL